MSRLKSLGLALVIVAALAAPAAATAAPPPNDAFASAEELTGRIVTVEGLNKDATKEPNEPDHAGEPGGASIWYRWTAPAGGRAVVSTCESDFDTVIAVYTGESVDDLAEEAANNNACGYGSRTSFDAVESETYRIAIDGVDADSGVAPLTLRLAPPNDDFEDAETLSGNEGSVEGTTVGASHQTDEPGYLSNTVWYRWTAPSSGTVTFEMCGSDLEAYLLAFSGDAVAALAYVSEGGCRMTFDATANVSYSVVVDSYEAGDFHLSWNRNPVPPFAYDYPDIAGLAKEGETLTAVEGFWGGTAPFSFAHAWGRCDAGYDRCDLIAGADSKTYRLTTADVGHHVYVRVTATNAAGSATEWSYPTSLVRASGPVNAGLPTISGEALVGEALTASNGIWSGPQPIQFAYQWQACDATGTACLDLAGERLSFIELGAVHVGKRLRIVVTATNGDGSRSVSSDASTSVAASTVTKQVRCVVPNVKGKSLRQAKNRIRRAHCKTGRVVRAYSNWVRRGRVISQAPKAGARMKQGARVKLVVSRGRKR